MEDTSEIETIDVIVVLKASPPHKGHEHMIQQAFNRAITESEAEPDKDVSLLVYLGSKVGDAQNAEYTRALLDIKTKEDTDATVVELARKTIASKAKHPTPFTLKSQALKEMVKGVSVRLLADVETPHDMSEDADDSLLKFSSRGIKVELVELNGRAFQEFREKKADPSVQTIVVCGDDRGSHYEPIFDECQVLVRSVLGLSSTDLREEILKSEGKLTEEILKYKPDSVSDELYSSVIDFSYDTMVKEQLGNPMKKKGRKGGRKTRRKTRRKTKGRKTRRRTRRRTIQKGGSRFKSVTPGNIYDFEKFIRKDIDKGDYDDALRKLENFEKEIMVECFEKRPSFKNKSKSRAYTDLIKNCEKIYDIYLNLLSEVINLQDTTQGDNINLYGLD